MTAHVRVYRVERRADGLGPYRGGFGYDEIHETESFGPLPQHPMPWDDGIGEVGKRAFAFATMTDLYRWFEDAARRRLAAAGYVIAVYHAARDTVTRGRCQCVFCKEHAARTRVLSLCFDATQEAV